MSAGGALRRAELSKYKFSLNPKIKGYIEWQLEHYPEDKKELEEYKQDLIPSATQSYSQTSGVQSGSTSNPTERDGLKLATNPYILATERNIRAIEIALQKCDGIDLKLIDLVYWKRSHTVEGAGMVAHVSKSAAYYRINSALCAIALEMGIVTL